MHCPRMHHKPNLSFLSPERKGRFLLPANASAQAKRQAIAGSGIDSAKKLMRPRRNHPAQPHRIKTYLHTIMKTHALILNATGRLIAVYSILMAQNPFCKPPAPLARVRPENAFIS